MSEPAEFTLSTTLSLPAAAATSEPPLKRQKTKTTVEATTASNITGVHAVHDIDPFRPERKKSVKTDVVAALSNVICVGEKVMDVDDAKKTDREICEGYFREIRTYLRDKPTRFHLVDEDFAIDNTVVDSRLEDLKRKIVEVASQQAYWGEVKPARWILLEQELMALRAAGMKVIPRRLVEDFSQVQSLQISTDEMDLFLRFQHDIGTILYFSIEVLKEKIVLDPQWMIDALKSLITAEMFVLRSIPAVSDQWFEFKNSGKLSPVLIDHIWAKEKHPEFHDNKEHILHLMETLNIIARPRSYNTDGKEVKVEDYFLFPCVLDQKAPREVISPGPNPQMESSSVLCYVFTGKFLPSPVFHRLLAACLAHWPIAKKKSENLIFCGSCVFAIDPFHKLTLYFKDYVIFVRVTKVAMKDRTPDCEVCIHVREFIDINLSTIIGYLCQNLKFEWYIQCPQSETECLKSMFPVSRLQESDELPCCSHDIDHVVDSQDLLKFWFEEKKEASKQDKRSEGHNNPITQEHVNHFRLCNALTTVCADALREILKSQVPASYANIYKAIIANQTNLTSRRQVRQGQWQNALLNKDQSQLVFPDRKGRYTGTLDEFDISLLYTLIRNVSSVPAPSTGWASPPTDQPRDRTLGASVERIRSYRNSISGHSVDGKISQPEFEDYWNKINDVLHDIEDVIGDHSFREELEKRRNQIIMPH